MIAKKAYAPAITCSLSGCFCWEFSVYKQKNPEKRVVASQGLCQWWAIPDLNWGHPACKAGALTN